MIKKENFSHAKNPLSLFKICLKKAYDSKEKKPDAFTLSTSDKKGKVTSRTLLLKKVTKEGLLFYSNYKSLKAKHLKENPYASLLFYWVHLSLQIHITGKTKKLSKRKSEAYWKTRSRTSQISQWISPQSRPIKKNQDLRRMYEEASQQFKDLAIPCPPHWGGYVLVPQSFEFLLEHPHRLHDRFFYKRQKAIWRRQKLFP